ncbi:hypothetical protein L195_g064516, partial [Trifolium pratense]
VFFSKLRFLEIRSLASSSVVQRESRDGNLGPQAMAVMGS